MTTVREWVDKVHEITDALERRANIELQKATSYHKGYMQACEDFGRAIRQELLDVGEDEWSLGSCDKGFWALGSYGGSLVFPSQLEAVAWRPLPEPYHPGKER